MKATKDDPDAAATELKAALADLEEIANLPGVLDDAFFLLSERRRDYPAFWQKAKEVSALFRTIRLRREIREPLWTKHSSLCEQVKDLQRREHERKYYESKQNRDEILSILREARTSASVASDFRQMNECRHRLGDAMHRMKENLLLQQDRNECWDLWREVNDMIPARRHEIRDRKYAEFQSEVSRIANLATYDDPYDALKAIQDVQRDLNAAELTRDQKEHFRHSLKTYWDVATERIEKRRAEKVRQHELWRGHMTDKCGRLGSLVEKNDGIVAGLRSQIDDLESKIADAWNEGWADRAREWVQEKYEKIADIERTNEELEDKILEIRAKLADQ
jgi:hypothetical protein